MENRSITINVLDIALNSKLLQICLLFSRMLVLENNFEIFIQVSNFF